MPPPVNGLKMSHLIHQSKEQINSIQLTTSDELLLLLLSPNVVCVVGQTLCHILHFSAKREIGHVDRMRIVVERVCRISLKLCVLKNTCS